MLYPEKLIFTKISPELPIKTEIITYLIIIAFIIGIPTTYILIYYFETSVLLTINYIHHYNDDLKTGDFVCDYRNIKKS